MSARYFDNVYFEICKKIKLPFNIYVNKTNKYMLKLKWPQKYADE